MQSFSGKVALVTGASRGLGQAIALALGEAKADVAVTDLLIEGEMVDHEKLAHYDSLTEHFVGTNFVQTKATAIKIQKMGSQSLALKMDVTKPEEIHKVMKEVEETLGG